MHPQSTAVELGQLCAARGEEQIPLPLSSTGKASALVEDLNAA